MIKTLDSSENEAPRAEIEPAEKSAFDNSDDEDEEEKEEEKDELPEIS